jgi:hypothetical protein
MVVWVVPRFLSFGLLIYQTNNNNYLERVEVHVCEVPGLRAQRVESALFFLMCYNLLVAFAKPFLNVPSTGSPCLFSSPPVALITSYGDLVPGFQLPGDKVCILAPLWLLEGMAQRRGSGRFWPGAKQGVHFSLQDEGESRLQLEPKQLAAGTVSGLGVDLPDLGFLAAFYCHRFGGCDGTRFSSC